MAMTVRMRCYVRGHWQRNRRVGMPVIVRTGRDSAVGVAVIVVVFSHLLHLFPNYSYAS